MSQNTYPYYLEYPATPALPLVDPFAELDKTTAGNIKSLPGIQRLAEQLNTFNADQQRKTVLRNVPSLGLAESLLDGFLRGRLSPETLSNTQRGANAGAFGLGIGGSPRARRLEDRDLGLKTLETQQRGIDQIPKIAAFLGPNQFFNTSSQLISPQDNLNFVLQDRAERFDRDLLQWQVQNGTYAGGSRGQSQQNAQIATSVATSVVGALAVAGY
jgi:hypothetical protein